MLVKGNMGVNVKVFFFVVIDVIYSIKSGWF